MVSPIIWTDQAGSTLASSINNSVTTATLAAGTGVKFPSPTGGQYFTLTFTSATNPLLQEITHCTARATDVVTIIRGQEGTSALAWTAGDLAQNLLTAASLAAMFTQILGGDLTGALPNPTIIPNVGLTGAPTAPTAALGTHTTQLATTQFTSRNFSQKRNQVFLSSGTFTVPADVYAIEIELWGGGGGSGGVGATNLGGAGGGGGGGYAYMRLDVTPAATYTVTIGAGGAGGGAGGSGGNGGTTSFDGVCNASGGIGGQAAGAGAGGAGGTGSGGDLNLTGSAGGAAATTGTAGGASGGGAPMGAPGAGGGSGLGGAGVAPGGGAGGSGSSITNTGNVGGLGLVIVRW